MATSNFYVAPEDGWVLVATDPGFLRISTQTAHRWSYAISGSLPAASVVGVLVEAGDRLVINEPFTGNVYVRTAGATPGYPNGQLRVDVTDLDVTGGGGGGGDASAANQSTQITAANLTNTNLGGVTETAPASDTASSGLNGRLQRIAQRLTTVNTTLGSPFQAGGSIGNTTFAATQATASSLNAQVVGSIAAAASDSGNPLKIGGVYTSGTQPTYTTGQRTNFNSDSRGNARALMLLTMAAATDGFSNSSIGLANRDAAEGTTVVPITANSVFNGTTWDRMRTITGAVADGTGLGIQAVETAGSLFSNITTATTTTVKSGKGILHKLLVNTFVASATITIYDNTAASGTKIGTLTLPSTITSDTPICLPYDLQFSTGLTFVTSGATDLTVIYR